MISPVIYTPPSNTYNTYTVYNINKIEYCNPIYYAFL